MRLDFCTWLGAVLLHLRADFLRADTRGNEFIQDGYDDYQPQPPQDHQLPDVQGRALDAIH